MSEGHGVVVVGSCMVDFVSYAERLPKEGETIHGTEFVTNFGGKGANQCVAAAKLGAKTALVARVGDDVWADKYINNLKTFDVNTEYLQRTPGSASGVAQITVALGGANQIVIVAGANLKLDTNDVSTAGELIRNAAVVVCQLETSPQVAIKSCQLCSGISILNGAPAISNYSEELLSAADIFCVNESEAEIFSGQKVESIKDGEAAIKTLLQKGCKSVILTLGSEGALYASKADPSSFTHVKSPLVKCVDSTGAGDAFIGALAFLLSSRPGCTMEKAITFACLVASDSVTKPGTQISFPGKEIVDKI